VENPAMTEPPETVETMLIVLRGNSGSGKSAVASAVRERAGRGIAIVRQDVVRREILWEKDRPDAVNIGLIETMVRHALEHGYHVILEGILHAGHYGSMLERLLRDYPGRSSFHYWHLPLEETLRRHASKPAAAEFGEADMRSWYVAQDLLPFVTERVFDARISLDEAVNLIVLTSGLVANPPSLHASASSERPGNGPGT
jgi:predicted kinase